MGVGVWVWVWVQGWAWGWVCFVVGYPSFVTIYPLAGVAGNWISSIGGRNGKAKDTVTVSLIWALWPHLCSSIQVEVGVQGAKMSISTASCSETLPNRKVL